MRRISGATTSTGVRPGRRILAGIVSLGLSACGQPQENGQSSANQPTAQATAGEHCPAPLSWGVQAGGPVPDAIRNRVSVDRAGHVYWNGMPIEDVTLHQYIDLTATMRPAPRIDLEVDPGTPCDQVSRTIALIGSLRNCSRDCSFAFRPIDPRRFRPVAAAEPARRELAIDDRIGRSIWSTSVYSYGPGGGGPGGGRADDQLRVGGWGDTYVSLIQFDLPDRRPARSATLLLSQAPATGQPTPMELAIVTRAWSWQAGDRLWWRDLPPAETVTRLAAPRRDGSAYAINITGPYNQWASGTQPNYGLMLRPTLNANNFNGFYSTRARGELRPRLVVVY